MTKVTCTYRIRYNMHEESKFEEKKRNFIKKKKKKKKNYEARSIRDKFRL
jgi:hypothetical protein